MIYRECLETIRLSKDINFEEHIFLDYSEKTKKYKKIILKFNLKNYAARF